MSKNIAISDDVYRERKRERGDRSFSEVIRDHLEEQRRLADVTGTGILDRETHEEVKDDIEQYFDRMNDVSVVDWNEF